MKLNRLINESAPTDIAELFRLTQNSTRLWDPDENPGDLNHGDDCPKCGRPVTNRRVGPGAPKFLGCEGDHAFLLPSVTPRVAEPDVGEVESLDHSCRFPPSGPEDEGRIRKGAQSGCSACKLLYDRSLDLGFGDDPGAMITDDDPSDDQEKEYEALLANLGVTPEQLARMSGREKAALLRSLILDDDKRAHHQDRASTYHALGGGTGRPEKMSPDDSLAMLYLKMKQQQGMRGGRVGSHGPGGVKQRIMDRGRHRDRCMFGHTCGFYPNGEPAANYPLPDPQATSYKSPDITGQGRYAGKDFIRQEGLTPGRFNDWFDYSPSSTRRWPVSGLSGFTPKVNYKDVIEAKYGCEVCLVRELGEARAEEELGRPLSGVEPCNNPVSQELGKLKPYCSEHAEYASYPAELMRQYGGPGLPDQPDPTKDYAERKAELEALLPEIIEVGDEVIGTVGKARKWGAGTVMQVDLSRRGGDTHYVDWSNGPEVWVKPQYLELPGGRSIPGGKHGGPPRLF